MTTFLLDLWQDLRAKRLWPIAVGLLLATVAVPALMFKPASTTAPTPGATPAADANKLPSVNLDASSVENSHLNVFREKNPFKSLADQTASSSAGTQGSVGSTASSTASSSGSGSTSSGGSTGGTSTGGTSAGSTGGGASSPNGPDGKPVKPGLHYFTYTADVRFGTRSKTKLYKGVKELQLLPGGKNPVVSFMGVKHGDTAVFFIADPAFKVDGEGSCKPSRKNCMFLYLKKSADHNEATLSAQDGQIEYEMKLVGLHVRKLSKKQAVGGTTPQKSPSSSKKANPDAMTLLDLPTLGLAK